MCLCLVHVLRELGVYASMDIETYGIMDFGTIWPKSLLKYGIMDFGTMEFDMAEIIINEWYDLYISTIVL